MRTFPKNDYNNESGYLTKLTGINWKTSFILEGNFFKEKKSLVVKVLVLSFTLKKKLV